MSAHHPHPDHTPPRKPGASTPPPDWAFLASHPRPGGSAPDSAPPSHPPLVSVIVPSYNCARFLPEALDSALGQTHPRVQVLVADDGSTDDTPAVLRRYADRITLLHTGHRGVAHARNRLLERADGTLIAFLDADDLWLPDKLALQVRAMLDRPDAALCHTATELFGADTGDGPIADELRRRVQGHCFPELFARNGIVTSSALVRRDRLPDPPFFTDMPFAEDYALWLRLLADRPALYLPRVLVRYRRHPEQASADLGKRRQVYSGIARLRCLQHEAPRLASDLARSLRDAALDELQTVAYSRYWQHDHAMADLGFRWLERHGRPVPRRHRWRSAFFRLFSRVKS